VARGARRALVTDGAKLCCDADAEGLRTACPPEVRITRVTGAGDTFMAAHIAAERGGASRAAALARALGAAATHVSGDLAT
jgi:sugar/nucleoside kinase (ribokinase family)